MPETTQQDAAATTVPTDSQGLDAIMRIGIGFWASKTLLSAVELGVFTEVACGPMDLIALRNRLGLHERGARDFFDTLVALGLLEREDGRYSNSPAADQFLDRQKAGYIGGFLEFCSERLYPDWAALTEALRTGRPQSTAKDGVDFFDALFSNEPKLRSFLRGMTGLSLESNKLIAAKFPFGQYAEFVDIGCAEGALPVQVALAHSHIRGGGFDLLPVEPIFTDYITSFGLQDRLTFHAGDFLEAPLPHADVLAMGHILHDWDLETKLMLLDKAYAALPRGGALIVHEAIIDDDRRRNDFGLLMSLNMLLELTGGFDFTGADCQEWMRRIGFRETEVQALAGPDSMVIAIK